MKPIRKVHTVQLQLLKSKPPVLVINAAGEVSSGGWKNGTLVPRIYLVPPQDGIADYEFEAEPPTGPSISVILPIVAQATLTDPPAWLRGIRIHSATNQVEALLGADTPRIDLSAPPAATDPGTRKIGLAMKLDPDVSFYETGVWLEGRFVDGWKKDEKNGTYVRLYENFPVANPLDVVVACRSRNEPSIKGALSLALAIADGTPSVLSVETKNFFGRAEAKYHV